MILNKRIFLVFIMLIPLLVLSQKKIDSLQAKQKSELLKEVVITGQYNPKSIKKSIFEVNVINRKKIDLQAGNNLADVLNQTLNISVIPSSSSGKSTIEMFGLDGQYIKVLVDNVPLINDEGLGNNTDLTQINLDDIQQIEIVEGSMGVQYGANAVAGVINIITKKSSKHKWEISPYIQEETIGNEYSLFEEGRHIQSVKIGHNFLNDFYTTATYTRNDFKGFLNGQQGKSHQLNDSLRGYSWLPKEQNTAKLLLNYSKSDNFRSFYKFEFFDEQVEQYSNIVQLNENASTNTTDPISDDSVFNSQRFYHLLNFAGEFPNNINYDISFSYQEQTRNIETFRYRIQTGAKFDIEKFEFESRNTLYSKGQFSNFIPNEKFDFQLGYEVNQIKGFASSTAGIFNGENINRKLNTYDVFSSSEIYTTNKKWSFRPGVRLLISSLFSPQLAASLTSKYNFKNGTELRVIAGSSPRLPNYDELYTNFVDANHSFRGNENLNPEQGGSIFAHLKKTFNTNSGFTIQSKLTLNYLNVKDRIESAIIDATAIPQENQFINIDSFNTIGSFLTNKINYHNLSTAFGIGLSGESKILDSNEAQNDDYLYTLQLNANASYRFKKAGLVLSANLKRNGQQQQFVEQVDDNGNTVLTRGVQDSYTLLDATLQKKLLKNKLQLTLGVRNLLNVTNVNTTAVEGETHSGPASTILLGYGRSVLLKLQYNFKFN